MVHTVSSDGDFVVGFFQSITKEGANELRVALLNQKLKKATVDVYDKKEDKFELSKTLKDLSFRGDNSGMSLDNDHFFIVFTPG